MGRVYILGGYQTDFARNWAKEGKHISAMLMEVMDGAFAETQIEPKEVESIHVGNFAAELYTKQGHLGAMVLSYHPDLKGIPTARHEAACASGAVATLAGRCEIEAGHYDLVMVIGVEYMRSVDSKTGGDYLGTAAWYEKEAKGISFPFPKLFGKLGELYDELYGLKYEHLAEISAINYANAKKNPLAQTRDWYMSKAHACSTGGYNTSVGGMIRTSDCSQVTDGAAAIFLASQRYAQEYAKKRNIPLEKIPYIMGWGHATAPLLFEEKVEEARRLRQKGEYILPATRKAILDAYRRAGLRGAEDLDAVETHDCFTTSEYAAIEHFGLTPPGEAWKAIEEGEIRIDGKLPFNPSGGLIGAGHPVGATGVRQILDAWRQVTENAGDYQVEGAKRVATLNIGGSATTNVVHIIGVD
ncbi:MAG: acetyl-CoA acetyltransferase [Leptospiraceae bacterium]|nr:acetyl-CoA acetyltransferase [Leptospiraceae bacterium]MDW8305490.1 acetyl-CoA acetyltransferase [Leptospiraceae bacterium]